jgi:hypothetical protein
MWGYDGLASSVCPGLSISNILSDWDAQIVLAINQFRQDYGTEFQGQFVIPAIWQLGLGGGSLFGLLFGGIGAGLVSKRWGRQVCMFLSYRKSPTRTGSQIA